MQYSPVCILLHAVKYGEKSMIIKTLHEEGLQSLFIYNYLRKGKNKYPFLRWPLAIVEIEINHSGKASLPVAKNLTLAYVPVNLSRDVMRQSVALFMADILYHFVKNENDQLENIYNYVIHAIKALDQNERLSTYFSIKFGYDIAELLGYGIHKGLDSQAFFNSKALQFQMDKDADCLGQNASEILKKILAVDIKQVHEIKTDNNIAKELFQTMIEFFKSRIPEAGLLKSPKILHDLFL